MFLEPDLKLSFGLTYVLFLACVACYLINYSALVFFGGLVFRFYKVLPDGVGGLGVGVYSISLENSD